MVPTVIIQRIAGVLVTSLALWEVYQRRDMYRSRRNLRLDVASFLDEEDYQNTGADNAEELSPMARLESEIEKVLPDSAYRKKMEDLEDFDVALEAALMNEKRAVQEESESSSTDSSRKSCDEEVSEQPVSKKKKKKPETRDFGTQTTVDVGTQTDFAPTMQERIETVQNFLRSLLNDTPTDGSLSNYTRFVTLLAGGASGFLGGLCGIRGPPIITYFLYPPIPFEKDTQRATAVCITLVNVVMRVAYYLLDIALQRENFFQASDWALYLVVGLASAWGSFVGSELFEFVKDARSTIRAILSIFLLLCGCSLLLTSFLNVS